MSKLVVKVCEECGAQSVNGEGWLVISNMDIRCATTDESLVHSEADTDICSPGCLLRHVSRLLEPAMNGHAVTLHRDNGKTVSVRAARIVA